MQIMKKIIAALALVGMSAAAVADPITYDALAFGKSFHVGNHEACGPCNGWNPGLALEARDGNWLVGAGGYRDSYNHFAKMAYVGYSYRHAVSDNWYLGATLRAGYLDGSGFHNWVPLPSVEVGYKRFSVEATYIPAIKSTQCGVIALWGKWAF
jgi:hypothetical protein